MVIPIYNNNPRAPMRDNVSRSKTTYSTRNAGGDGTGEETRVSRRDLPCRCWFRKGKVTDESRS